MLQAITIEAPITPDYEYICCPCQASLQPVDKFVDLDFSEFIPPMIDVVATPDLMCEWVS